jgi:hypothetical protein
MVNFICIENINDFFDSEAVNVNTTLAFIRFFKNGFSRRPPIIFGAPANN